MRFLGRKGELTGVLRGIGELPAEQRRAIGETANQIKALLEVGASWLYIALHRFGGMPAPLALIGTAAFCAYLALYPALAGWLATRWTKPGSIGASPLISVFGRPSKAGPGCRLPACYWSGIPRRRPRTWRSMASISTRPELSSMIRSRPPSLIQATP